MPGLDSCRRYFADHVAKTRVAWTGSAPAEQPDLPSFASEDALRAYKETVRQEVMTSLLGRKVEDARAEMAAMFERQRAARRAKAEAEESATK